MTNLSVEPSNDILSNSPDQWHYILSRVMVENQKILNETMATGDYKVPKFSDHLSIFDPEVVTTTFSETLKKLSEKPEQFIGLQQKCIEHAQDVWQAIMKPYLPLPTESESQEIPKAEKNTIDKRFQDPLWSKNPSFSLMQEVYQLNSQFLKNTVANLEGLNPKTQNKLNFYTKHLVDALSPTNFPFTNPQVIRETFETKGENLIQGFRNFLRDTSKGKIQVRLADENAFQVGENLATTPGKVVFQNDLFQLIQYAPTTKSVMKLPLLIIPPWINKYYIFDLRPENSFIKWAVDSGITVFIVSWVNPDKKHAKKTFDDYVLEGAKAAIDQACKITKSKYLNAIGYCSGGVLLSSLLSYMSVKKDGRVKSATIIATPVDFKEAGDLLVYICEQQLQKIEAHAQKRGYLEGQSMVQSFNLLRANELIWSSYINNYLMGKEPFPFDMLYWNSDALRMPATMHVSFLRKMFLENRLIKPGGITVDSVKIDLSKIKTPIFLMGAIDDHIAPWRAVYPLTQQVKTIQKFVLGASGHVAGVFNHPSRNKYHYWTGENFLPKADEWFEQAEKQSGSWWPEWRQWLEGFSGGTIASRDIPTKEILENAPGSYAMTMAE